MTLLRRGARSAGALLLLTLVGGCAADPAPARPAPAELESDRLLRHVEVLAADSMEGRLAGSPGAARARRYLLAELESMGLAPVGGSHEHPFTFTRGPGAPERGVNLVGRIAGTSRPERHLVVTAHYDHVGVGRPVGGDSIYNGADDNASGVAALLEIARYFRRNPPAGSILFALLDAEEGGLSGARALVADPPVPFGSIALNVNLDMVGHSESGELYVAGAAHYPWLQPLLAPVAARAPVDLRFGHDRPDPGPDDDWTLQSDHAAFHEAGIPFAYFGVEDHPDYHRPSDELGSLTPDFFVRAAHTVLDAIRTLDATMSATSFQLPAASPASDLTGSWQPAAGGRLSHSIGFR